MNRHHVASAIRQLGDAISELAIAFDEQETSAAPPPVAKTLPRVGYESEAKEILTCADAAALLQLHPKQIVRFVRTKGLPGLKMGRGWRFRRSEVLAWLGKQDARH